MTNSSLDFITDASFELGRVMRTAFLSKLKDKPKMNPLQIHAVVLISQNPRMTMKEFAKCMKVTGPSATVFASRLSRMGWVTRVHDAKNRKLVRLRLTPQGMKLLSGMQDMHRKAARSVFGHLSAQDQKTLASLLKKLLTSPAFHS